MPIDEQRIGFGQIVSTRSHNFIMIVFEGTWDKNEKPKLKEIAQREILFMGYSMDAKLYHKHWEIIGNYNKNLKQIELPYYRLGTPPDEIYLLDHTGKKIRPCTEEEFEKLKYRKVKAAVEYELALKAYYGQQEWEEDFEELKPENLLAGRRAIEA